MRHIALPFSNRSAYDRRVRALLARPRTPPALVTEADLAPLPPPVRRYLVRTGAVGRPRVQHAAIRFHGTIRESAASPWMSFEAVQHNAFDVPERLFYLRASRAGMPVDVFHAFRPDDASMRVRLAGLVPLADASGPTLARSETVTFLNDLCVFAPAALLAAPIVWGTDGADTVTARYTLGTQTVSARLFFDAAGDLVDFVSEDRCQHVGGVDRRLPWTTPLSAYRTLSSGVRLPSRGEGWWHPAVGAFSYLRLEVDDVAYDVVTSARA